MNQIFKIIKPIHWVITGLVLVIIAMAILWPRAPRPSAEYRQERQELTAEQKLLQQNQAIILKNIDLQEKLIQVIADKDAALIQAIKSNETKIFTIREQANDKINRVDGYGSNDLQRYFAEVGK